MCFIKNEEIGMDDIETVYESKDIECAMNARTHIRTVYGSDSTVRDHAYEFVDEFNRLLEIAYNPKKKKVSNG